MMGTFELCADGELNRHEVAALIAKVIGRDVRADRLDPRTRSAKKQRHYCRCAPTMTATACSGARSRYGPSSVVRPGLFALTSKS